MALLSKLHTYENKYLNKENAINPNVVSIYRRYTQSISY